MKPENDSKSGPERRALVDCPASPNCVSSQAERSARRVAPIGYAGERDNVREVLLAVLRSWPRTEIVHADEAYIHAIQRSRWFGFVDDLECLLPPAESLVHVRSASRSGYYDFGANRARVDRLRRAVNQRLADAR